MIYELMLRSTKTIIYSLGTPTLQGLIFQLLSQLGVVFVTVVGQPSIVVGPLNLLAVHHGPKDSHRT